MKRKEDNEYITRAMLREDGYVTRAMLREDEYVTRSILREEFEKFETRFEAKLDAKFDHKLEIMHRRIIEDITNVIHDLMDHQAETLYSMNKRVSTIETKLTKASAALR